jgi:hypothetical protein
MHIQEVLERFQEALTSPPTEFLLVGRLPTGILGLRPDLGD